MSKTNRAVVVYGNDTHLNIQMHKFDKTSGEYIDFDLTQVTDLNVFLICSKHATEIHLDYTINSQFTNIITCDIDYRLLHPNASYGIVVEGYDGQDHFRYEALPSEGFLVISNTSGLKVTDEVNTIDLSARTGWGISVDGADLTNYYTKDEVDALLENIDLEDYYDKTETDDLLDDKQDTLVSGTNIKTINNQSILGAGNITIQGGGGEQVQANWEETDTTDPSYIQNKPDLSQYATQTDLATKQDTLVSGQNIKTVNNQSLLGSGNITIQAGDNHDSADEATANALYELNERTIQTNQLLNELDEHTDASMQQMKNDVDSALAQSEAKVNASLSEADDEFQSAAFALNTLNTVKQDTLVSGTNIKTINNESVLGAGNLTITQVQADWSETGTSSPSYIQNKPTIPTTTSELTNDSGFLTSAVTSFNGATGAVTYTAPVTSVNGQTGAVVIETGEHDYSKDYLTFEALQNNTQIMIYNNLSSWRDISYSVNNGLSWTTVRINASQNTTLPSINKFEKILIKGSATYYASSIYAILRFSTSAGTFKIYGNIMSLINGDDFINKTLTETYAFTKLFNICSGLVDAENLIFPTNTQQYCYYQMFNGCDKLIKAPVLPAKSLQQYCYYQMFNGCTSLIQAPVLPAKSLQQYCYYQMFNGCTELNYVNCKATSISASSCTTGWLNNVAPKGLFIPANNSVAWSSGVNGIPTGWTTGTEEDYNYVHNFELATVATSGNYNDLTNKPSIPASPVQSNWNETDNTSLAYIQNKPTIPSTTGMVTGYIAGVSTNNLKIDVVATLPASPDSNTIYIVQ